MMRIKQPAWKVRFFFCDPSTKIVGTCLFFIEKREMQFAEVAIYICNNMFLFGRPPVFSDV